MSGPTDRQDRRKTDRGTRLGAAALQPPFRPPPDVEAAVLRPPSPAPAPRFRPGMIPALTVALVLLALVIPLVREMAQQTRRTDALAARVTVLEHQVGQGTK